MSGGTCGPVAGGMAALGLYYGHFEQMDHYIAGRRLIRNFEAVFGSLRCPDVQKQVLGRSHDPFSGPEAGDAFNLSGAREKCPVAPGLGARRAAGIIIASMEKKD